MTRAPRLLASLSSATLATLLFAPTVGCTPGESEDDAAEAADEVDESGDAEDESSTGTDESTTGTDESTTGTEPVGSASGMAADASGTALPSPFFQRCGPIVNDIAQSCISFQSDETGAFTIDFPQTGEWGLKFLDSSGDRTFAGHLFTVDIAEGDTLEIAKTVTVPEVTAITALPEGAGPTPVDIDGGLSITVDPGNSETVSFTAPTEFGGVQFASDIWMIEATDAGPVVATWSFYPSALKVKEGAFEFTISDGLGLAAGTPVVVYEMEKNNIVLHEVATGSVNAEGTALELAQVGEGLHELSMLIVADAS